ncbi:hypothetical protein I302_107941 [Kwoniella bestiolae CBS 10118]|uniref:Kelch repeat protein n=1 Tax=Kwoniella bestiolae CBS 10118 TaxID=1296100 RepID=A0A1B9FX42_9TREE|nr:hypothetical protein I302_07696 [Kwoniella bestiolae CBS 10118]OCF23342.1 hypothetical protein I302_07696 [Kwoniella bestiolae CBS 10118]
MSVVNLSKITAALPRSSHSISVSQGKAYIYGGEINPREPVDGDVHSIDLATGTYERIAASGQIPQSRVGHVAGVINGKIYVFGGRGGPSMTPLQESGSVHVYDITTSSWSTLRPNSSQFPCARSYHCSTTSDKHLIVHAGCGDSSTGRLKDTWSFEVSTSEWSKLPGAPGDSRGGSSIAILGDSLWRFGGFNGKTEVGGTIDYLNYLAPQPEWKSITFGDLAGLGRDDSTQLASSASSPGARSVAGLQAVNGRLIVIGGEGKPSLTGGHDAAGNFWDDIWSFDPAEETWVQLNPWESMEARGWFPSDVTEDGAIVVWGGINSKNERLGDGWVLRL